MKVNYGGYEVIAVERGCNPDCTASDEQYDVMNVKASHGVECCLGHGCNGSSPGSRLNISGFPLLFILLINIFNI